MSGVQRPSAGSGADDAAPRPGTASVVIRAVAVGTAPPDASSQPCAVTVYGVPGASGASGVTKTRRLSSDGTTRAGTGPAGPWSVTEVAVTDSGRSGAVVCHTSGRSRAASVVGDTSATASVGRRRGGRGRVGPALERVGGRIVLRARGAGTRARRGGDPDAPVGPARGRVPHAARRHGPGNGRRRLGHGVPALRSHERLAVRADAAREEHGAVGEEDRRVARPWRRTRHDRDVRAPTRPVFLALGGLNQDAVGPEPPDDEDAAVR